MDIELGLFLNFIFWIVALPAVVIIAVWLSVVFFEARQKEPEDIPAGSGRSPLHPSPMSGKADKRYRKVA